MMVMRIIIIIHHYHHENNPIAYFSHLMESYISAINARYVSERFFEYLMYFFMYTVV